MSDPQPPQDPDVRPVVRRRSVAPPSQDVARRRQLVVGAAVVVVLLGLVTLVAGALGGDGKDSANPTTTSSGKPATTTTTTAKPTKADKLAQTAPKPDGTLSPPAGFGRPWSSKVKGTLTFRGNPTRTYYGSGPAPQKPKVRWYYPKNGGMCATSSAKGVTKTWCGGGWTGQPAVFERDGRTWVVFGAYDKAIHFMDADTGEDILPPFPTGDIIKGSVTIDPDGYPLVYSGSRDNYYRVIAIDRPGQAVELWKLSATAVSPTLWNNDWDGSGLILDDYLLEGGENSQFHMVKLNRNYGADKLVTVASKLVFNTPSWDAQAISDLRGNRANEMSIENSVAVYKNTVYFANSGGLVSGWDLEPVVKGTGPARRTFRFWTGDDTDASVVIDGDGFLYVAVEYERSNARAAEVGQLMKLDPSKPENPLVWKYDDRGANPAGIWATPAVVGDAVIAPTNGGKLFAVDRATGAELWSLKLAGPTWQSPVWVDGVLVQGDCNGVLHGYDLPNPTKAPKPKWTVNLGGCIEATPAMWEGNMYFATRGGRFFSVGDDGTLTSPTAGIASGGGGD
ncbi:MAG: PQQ-binding-like beta-propeller repeat protein [Actinomycetes bacterium]